MDMTIALKSLNEMQQTASMRLTIISHDQGSKISLVRSFLRVPQAAGQVKILIFLVKVIFFPRMPIFFVMQGKCRF